MVKVKNGNKKRRSVDEYNVELYKLLLIITHIANNRLTIVSPVSKTHSILVCHFTLWQLQHEFVKSIPSVLDKGTYCYCVMKNIANIYLKKMKFVSYIKYGNIYTIWIHLNIDGVTFRFEHLEEAIYQFHRLKIIESLSL